MVATVSTASTMPVIRKKRLFIMIVNKMSAKVEFFLINSKLFGTFFQDCLRQPQAVGAHGVN